MFRFVFTFSIMPILAASVAFGQASHAPLRVGIVGLVHGHVHGFLDQSRHSTQIEIVGVAEPDGKLLSQAGARYNCSPTWKLCLPKHDPRRFWSTPIPTITGGSWKSARNMAST
jgi:hypothetical protein